MRAALVLLLLSAGCTLDPLADDDIDLTRLFGDPDIDPLSARHVEDNPDYQDRLGLFPLEVPYLRAYANGEKIWYWRLADDVPDFIASYYFVVLPDGSTKEPIFDVIPGDGGYSPWWRIVLVQATSKYAGERIWSREAIDAGVELGILEPPVETEDVITAPVVRRTARIQVYPDPLAERVEPSWGWYRNERVSVVYFKDSTIPLDLGVRRMPRAPVYVLSRINESQPLFEHPIGIDLDGDDRLISSNNIFTAKVGEPGYTPMWYPIGVRTKEDYVSIDTVGTSTRPVGLRAESDFIGADYGVVVSEQVIPPLDVQRDFLELCPIQKAFGAL